MTLKKKSIETFSELNNDKIDTGQYGYWMRRI